MTDSPEYDFFTESAKLLAGDRPDLYDFPKAFAELVGYRDELNSVEGNTWVSFASYVLVKAVDDGMVEWTLTRKLTSLSEFPEDNESYTLAHVQGTSLMGVDELLDA